jgi:hypothetical protein
MIHHRANLALRLAVSLSVAVLLSSCNQQTPDSKVAAAGGEVLPGSISDAMIDLDTSTAAPPLAPVKSTTRAKPASDASSAATEDEPAAAASGDTQ